jgi:hypothetical protein
MRERRVLKACAMLFATSAATLPLGLVAAHAWAGPRPALSVLLGAGLATMLAISSLALAAWSYEKSQATFLAALLGGFMGRLVFLGGCIALLIAASDLPVAPFMASLFAYYVLYQFLEIRALHRLRAARPLRTPR